MIGTIYSLNLTWYQGYEESSTLYWNYYHVTKKVEQVVDISSYELCLESTDNSTGTVTIAGDLNGDYTNCFIEIEGFDTPFSVADKVNISQHTSTMAVGDFCSAVSGVVKAYETGDDASPVYLNDAYQAFFGGTGTGRNPTTGATIPVGTLVTFTSERTGCFHATNTITLDNTIDVTELVSDGYLDASNLMRYICSLGYKFELQGLVQGQYAQYKGMLNKQDDVRTLYTNMGMYFDKCYGVKLTQYSRTAVPIYFEDGHSFLESATLNDDNVTNVYIWYNTTASGTPVYTQAIYGLQSDGTAAAGNSDIIGKTSYYSTSDNLSSAQRIAKAQEIFDANTTGHSVVFRSDKEFHIGQPVKLMLSTGALDSAISKVVVSSNHKLKQYTCGGLADNAASQIKANSWSYGKRLPVNPRKGELVLL